MTWFLFSFSSSFSDWRLYLTKIGEECPRIWDGLLCWPPTPANVTSHLACPGYVDGFDVLVSLNIIFILSDPTSQSPLSPPKLMDTAGRSSIVSGIRRNSTYLLLSIHALSDDDSTASFPFFPRLGGRPCLLKARQWSSRSFRITRHVIYSAAPARLHPWTHRKDFPPFLTSLRQPDLMPSVTQWPFWKHFDVYTFVWLTQQSLSSIIPVGGIQPANPVVYGSCWQPGVRPPALWKSLHQLCLIRMLVIKSGAEANVWKKKAGTLQTIGRKIELLKIDKFRFLCRILKFPIDFQFGTKIKEWRTKK